MTGPLYNGTRFGAPPRDRQQPRYRAAGLGGQPEVVAADESPSMYDLQATTPSEGFTGIFSRSRFDAPAPPALIGHGYESVGVGAPPEPFDPATGRTQFPKAPLDPGTYWAQRTSDIVAGAAELVARGFLNYVRGPVDQTVPGQQLQDPNAMGWGKNPPRAIRWLRYTVRPEFGQGAQSFSGLHTLIVKGARMSTSPARMGPARTNRLTNRAAPGSYGQKTKVL